VELLIYNQLAKYEEHFIYIKEILKLDCILSNDFLILITKIAVLAQSNDVGIWFIRI